MSTPSAPTTAEPGQQLTDPGVTVPGGNPASITSAAEVHEHVAETLEEHSSLLKSTASVLLGQWTGEASKEYSKYSAELSGHYEITAAEARAVSSALKKFSSELGTAQGEGKVALKEAIYWMNQVNKWNNKLSKDKEAYEQQEETVKQLQATANAANSAASGPHPAPDAASKASSANSALAAAKSKAATLKQNCTTDEQKMKAASEHFSQWQKKGGTALQKAEEAAGVAGLALADVALTNPAVAKDIDSFQKGISSTVTASAFAGWQGSAAGGGPLANYSALLQAGAGASATATGSLNLFGASGDANVDAFFGEQGTGTANAGWSQFGVGVQGQELVGGDANADVNGQFGVSGIDASATGSAFLGAELNGSGTANLGPATATGTAGVKFGVGVDGSASADFSAHKIGFSLDGGLALGPGFNLGVSVSVDPAKVVHDIEPWHWHL